MNKLQISLKQNQKGNSFCRTKFDIETCLPTKGASKMGILLELTFRNENYPNVSASYLFGVFNRVLGILGGNSYSLVFFSQNCGLGEFFLKCL